MVEESGSGDASEDDAKLTLGRPGFLRRKAERDETPHANGPERQVKASRPRRPVRFPRLRSWPAAVVTGVVVGLVGVALIWLGGRGCEAARGTDSCGGVGLLLLIAIMSAMVLLGSRLQRTWKVADPVNSSFLAVGLVAVVVMLFLLGHDDDWWMWLVVPALSATAYAVSWWVTATFIDRDPDR